MSGCDDAERQAESICANVTSSLTSASLLEQLAGVVSWTPSLAYFVFHTYLVDEFDNECQKGCISEAMWGLMLSLCKADPDLIKSTVWKACKVCTSTDVFTAQWEVLDCIQELGFELPDMSTFVCANMHNQSDTVTARKVITRLVHEHGMHKNFNFLVTDGVCRLLMFATTDMGGAEDLLFDILVNCVESRFAELVLHSPNLVDSVEIALVNAKHRKECGRLCVALLKVTGTAFIVRLVREKSDDFDVVANLVFGAVRDHVDIHEFNTFLALWPKRLNAALKRPDFGEMAPVTSYECPILHEPCVDPVVTSDGHTYERDAILTHLVATRTSPMTRNVMHGFVVRNTALILNQPYSPPESLTFAS